MWTPTSFTVYFWPFQTNIIKKLQQICLKNVRPSIQCQDLNPWPLEHDSPAIIPRPGLPLLFSCYMQHRAWQQINSFTKKVLIRACVAYNWFVPCSNVWVFESGLDEVEKQNIKWLQNRGKLSRSIPNLARSTFLL